MRQVRIGPSGMYVDWPEEFAGVSLGLISRLGSAAGPAAPIALLASQGAAQLIQEFQFPMSDQQIAKIAAGDYQVGYVCMVNYFIDEITVGHTVGGNALAEFMVQPAGGVSARRITRTAITWEDGDAPAHIVCEGTLIAYLTPAMVAVWAAGINLVQFGLSFPGPTTGTVPALSCQFTVAEIVGNPGIAI